MLNLDGMDTRVMMMMMLSTHVRSHKTLASPISPVCVIDIVKKERTRDGDLVTTTTRKKKPGAGGASLIIIKFSAGYELLACKAQ